MDPDMASWKRRHLPEAHGRHCRSGANWWRRRHTANLEYDSLVSSVDGEREDVLFAELTDLISLRGLRGHCGATYLSKASGFEGCSARARVVVGGFGGLAETGRRTWTRRRPSPTSDAATTVDSATYSPIASYA